MARILCTGGAGFIGSHLVDRLIENGHDVTVVDNLITGDKSNLNPKAKFVELDICKSDEFLSKFDDHSFDYIYHLAAQINLRKSIDDPHFDAEINILGSLNVIELAKKHGAKLIFASTGGAIYSPYEALPWAEWSEADPQSPYGLAKLTVERYIRISNINSCILRLANVYGPRQNSKSEAGVISIFISKIINSESLTIFGDGNQTRDFVYVSDVVDAFIIAQDQIGVINVSSGEETSVLDIANLVRDRMWHNADLVFKPEVPGELRRSLLDNVLLRTTGWEKKVSLEDGIAYTVNYFAK